MLVSELLCLDVYIPVEYVQFDSSLMTISPWMYFLSMYLLFRCADELKGERGLAHQCHIESCRRLLLHFYTCSVCHC